MQITQRTWSSLLLKFLKGTISKPEREELDRQRAQSSMKEAQFKRVSSPRWMLSQLKDYHRLQKEESVEPVLVSSPAVPETLAWQPRPSFTMNWKVAASLAGLALVSMMTYWLWTAEKKVIPASEISAALPNKARLILADKTSFALNEIKDGLLVKNGSSSILKKNGVLILEGPTLFKDSATRMNELVLPVGSPYKLQLPDGSLVSMLASSRIRFPTHFSPTERRVEIEGEGFLEVAKNPAVPFIVQLPNDYAVQVKGTSFYVSAYPEEEGTRVKLVEGKVDIHKLKGNSKPIELAPDQEFMGSAAGDAVVAVTAVRADQDAWEENKFNLNKDLRAILQDIAHWHGVPLQYPAALPNPVLHGRLDRGQSLSKAIERLQQNVTVKIRLTGNTINVAQ